MVEHAALWVGSVETPLGRVWLAASAVGLRAVTVPDSTREACLAVAGWTGGEIGTGGALITSAIEQLSAYFAGRLQCFTLPLDLQGTPFQHRVWQTVAGVPYGETATYREVACRIDSPRAYRAVGAANGANPAAIVIPCHRLVGSDGALRGYGGGLAQKQALLDLEASYAGRLVRGAS